MAKCMSCEKFSLLTCKFGNVILCNKCGSLINISAWKDRSFNSINDLLTKRDNAVQSAKSNNVPQMIIDEITKYFQEYIDAGFILSLDGKAGQTIKVFSDHCIVYTESEGKKNNLVDKFFQFDPIEIENKYDEYDDDDDDDDEIFSSRDKKNIVYGLMSGKIVKTGVDAAVTAVLNKQEKEKQAEKKATQKRKQKERIRRENEIKYESRYQEREKRIERLIHVGESRIDFNSISDVIVYSKAKMSNGYLQFVPNGCSPDDLYKCNYFFFNNSTPFQAKKTKSEVENLRNIISKQLTNKAKTSTKKSKSTKTLQKDSEKEAHSNNMDVFVEIRNFKQLLDEGIISQEEFDAKKKELLKL